MEDRLIPNRQIRFVMLGIQSIMGHNGLNAMLKLAGLARYLNTLPPDNNKYDAHTSELAALFQAIENHFGNNARIQLNRIGHAIFRQIYLADKAQWQIHAILNRFLPPRQRLINALKKLGEYFSENKATIKVEAHDQHITFTDHSGFGAWSHTHESDMCWLTLGTLDECTLWATGNAYQITEVACQKKGDESCVYEIGDEL